ncbi:SMI1/KNR4 family protein [Pontibacter korlensis]|uniref:1,3-beta-glucan synthase regulator n=1 Tax=Pontibacter korlensis TaxID=400092 RepID=A0A0E3ZBX9_9BACT|nr:SMI1/KNR4 family protein [Pontibacter korlensis]AKD02113.1 1,3-beta-glucan synthase regulator [Pontibacter korlensis]
MDKSKIDELVYKFESLGKEVTPNRAILLGRAPHLGPKAWLNIIYPSLSKEEISDLENELKTSIPKEYREFLMNYANGLNVLSSTFSLYGLRRQINRNVDGNIRQPYSLLTPNLHERPEGASESYFFIGGYNWDGSHLYIDKKTNIVHCCERWNAESKIQWTSFEEMVISEISRLYLLFDEKGREFDEDNATIPY